MTTKQELRDEIARLTADRDVWRGEAEALRVQRNQARSERNQVLAAQIELQRIPEPRRPFQVGDRVRVAKGAMFRHGDGGPVLGLTGKVGRVSAIAADGDLIVDDLNSLDWAYVSPEFCTLVSQQPQPVTLTLPDGTKVTFDAVVTK